MDDKLSWRGFMGIVVVCLSGLVCVWLIGEVGIAKTAILKGLVQNADGHWVDPSTVSAETERRWPASRDWRDFLETLEPPRLPVPTPVEPAREADAPRDAVYRVVK